MKGLPLHPGVTGWAIWITGLLVGTLYAWRIRKQVSRAVGESLTVGSIVLLLIATGLGSAPFVGWRIIVDVRYTSQIDPWLVPRYGVSEHGVHPEIFDNAAARIPSGDTYYLAPSPRLNNETQAAFRQWALGYLLPRIAVGDPERADWILTLGVDPASVGPDVSRTWIMKEAIGSTPPAYLGRVRN